MNARGKYWCVCVQCPRKVFEFPGQILDHTFTDVYAICGARPKSGLTSFLRFCVPAKRDKVVRESSLVAAAQVLRPQGAVRRSALYEATPGSGRTPCVLQQTVASKFNLHGFLCCLPLTLVKFLAWTCQPLARCMSVGCITQRIRDLSLADIYHSMLSWPYRRCSFDVAERQSGGPAARLVALRL